MATSSKKRKRKIYENLSELITASLDSVVFDAEGIEGYANLKEDAKLVVVFGDNASGKSLMLTVFRAFIGIRSDSGAETLSVSMQSRTTSGMAQVFMYADESYNSTGAASLQAVRGCFHNAERREHPVWLLFDEPDTGLSDRYASAFGAYLAQQVNSLPANIRGVVLVTHSRPLLRRLLAELNEPPHEVSMGVDQTLAQYVDPVSLQEASIEELFAFSEKAGTTMKSVMSILHPRD